ncbi:MAG: ATP-binding protein [Gaiella sp.]|nr:ATP-binding protein [Gaiella sp.]
MRGSFDAETAVEQLLQLGITESYTATDTRPSSEPVGAYITTLEVEGFRGIGERACLELVPGPGLTLVIGRNGSGKSSFAEAMEVLLTGDNPRWAKRSAVC